MINGLSFDIEDWFQVENLSAVCPFAKWDSFDLRVERNTMVILDLLERYNTKATFFVLGWVANKLPKLINNIYRRGHEIASHGYNHKIVYTTTPDEFRKDLLKSKTILEDITGDRIIGYRAPNFSITKDSLWAIDILKELKFEYDSSIFPTSIHDRYGFQGVKDCNFFKFKNGLWEFPLTVYKAGSLKLPLAGGGYFRLMPYNLFTFLLNRINIKGKPFIFYLHPWELDPGQPRINVKKSYYIRHYLNLGKTKQRLERLLRDFKLQELKKFLC